MEILTAVPVQYWIVGVWAVACGAYDLTVRRLPNALTLGAHGGALTMIMVTGKGLLGASPSSCIGAWALALVLTVPAYALKRLGAGDVKLLAAMGLAGGIQVMLTAYAIAGLLVGGTAIVWMMAYRWEPLLAAPLACIGIDFPVVPKPKGRMLPFGLGLAIGFIVALVILTSSLPVLSIHFI